MGLKARGATIVLPIVWGTCCPFKILRSVYPSDAAACSDSLFDAVSSLKEELKLFVRNRSKDIIKSVVDGPGSRRSSNNAKKNSSGTTSGGTAGAPAVQSAVNANTGTGAQDLPLAVSLPANSVTDENTAKSGSSTSSTPATSPGGSPTATANPSSTSERPSSLTGSNSSNFFSSRADKQKQKQLGPKSSSFSLGDTLKNRSASSHSLAAGLAAEKAQSSSATKASTGSRFRSFAARLSRKEPDQHRHSSVGSDPGTVPVELVLDT